VAAQLKLLHAAASENAAGELFAALRAVHGIAVSVLFLTPEFDADPQKNTLTQLALAAHAEGRLVVVSSGAAEAPLGLRDVTRIEWQGGDAADVVAAIKDANKRGARRRGKRSRWPLWTALAIIGVLLVGVMAGGRYIFAPPAPEVTTQDVRSELLRLLAEGQLTPEQAIQLAELMESRALEATDLEGYLLSSSLSSGRLEADQQIDVALPTFAQPGKIVALCFGPCTGITLQLLDSNGTRTAENNGINVSIDTPAGVQGAVARISCSGGCFYMLNAYARGLVAAAPELTDVLARLEALEGATQASNEAIGGVQAALYGAERKLATNTQILWAIGFAVALQLLLVIVLLVRRSGERKGVRESPMPAPAASGGQFVFASYARLDRARVDEIVREMESEGVTLWLDRKSIGGGTTWPEEIVRAIRGARGVILFCSPSSFASDAVLREISLASAYGKPLLPVLIEPAQTPDGFMYYLSTRQIIDLSNDPAGRQKLVAALKAAA
jgi:hypothetical protein